MSLLTSTLPTLRGYVFSGSARLVNVEFLHTGQEGFVAKVDSRYSITFYDIWSVSKTRPSYISRCTFHNGFSPAIGVIATNNLKVEDNVIHHTVGPGKYES